jgi:WW domain-binding protein 4
MQAAHAAFAQDVGAGLVKPGNGSAIASTSHAGPSKPAVKPSDPYANYSTAASLGYVDPDAERQKIETERRMREGVVGVWEVVDVPSGGAESAAHEDEDQVQGDRVDAAGELEHNRPSEVQAIDDDDVRPWKLRKKTLGPGIGELYDPGIIPIKLKAKKEELVPDAAPSELAESGKDKTSSSPPKWSAKGWNRPGDALTSSTPAALAETQDAPATSVKQEIPLSPALESASLPAHVDLGDAKQTLLDTKAEESLNGVKSEQSESNLAPTGNSLFRKRKAPSASRARR